MNLCTMCTVLVLLTYLFWEKCSYCNSTVAVEAFQTPESFSTCALKSPKRIIDSFVLTLCRASLSPSTNFDYSALDLGRIRVSNTTSGPAASFLPPMVSGVTARGTEGRISTLASYSNVNTAPHWAYISVLLVFGTLLFFAFFRVVSGDLGFCYCHPHPDSLLFSFFSTVNVG